MNGTMPCTPLVSVIIPAHNAGAFIEETLDSVLGQDYPSLDVIVVDDGSTDDTVARVHRYGGRVLLLTQSNAGPAAARNLALAQARGELIAFVDADDVWLPSKLRMQVAFLEAHPQVGVVYTGWVQWHPDAEGRFPRPAIAPPDAMPPIVTHASGWLYTQLLFDCILLTSTVMMRRSLQQQVGPFDEAFKRGQDYDYWLRAARVTEMCKLDATLVLYRMYSSGGSNIVVKYPNENWPVRVLEKAERMWGLAGPDGVRVSQREFHDHLGRLWFDFGYRHFWSGQPALAAHAFSRCVHLNPGSVKPWVYLLMSRARQLSPWRKAS